jgi:DNA polymerase III epsilon subunit-like protein
MTSSDSKVVYISVDIEASGPIPGEYSMLSVGACKVGDMDKNFYVELRPISERFTEEAIRVCGLDMQVLKERGVEPQEAIGSFVQWVGTVAGGKKPVLVGFNAGFDWSFVNYYFVKFLGKNQFGISCIDIKSVWFGKKNCEWTQTYKKHIKRALALAIPHTHNALDDAKEQAVIFEKIITSV